MQNELRLRLDFKVIYKALILLVLAFIPAALVHEVGHSMICNLEGGHATMQVSWTGVGNTICVGTITDPFLYHFAGGLLAAVVSGLPLIFWKKIPNFVKVVSVAFVIAQTMNAIIESVDYTSYITQTDFWSGTTGIVNMMIFVGLVFYFGRAKQ